MPDYVVCTRAIKGGSFSSEPGPTRLFTGSKLSNAKRVGVAPPRARRVGLPDNAPAKAVGVDCGVRFLKTHPVTNPVVDPISHGWYFDDPVFLRDLTFTLASDMDRNVIPTRVATPTLSL